jgi:hypothetical protein
MSKSFSGAQPEKLECPVEQLIHSLLPSKQPRASDRNGPASSSWPTKSTENKQRHHASRARSRLAPRRYCKRALTPRRSSAAR